MYFITYKYFAERQDYEPIAPYVVIIRLLYTPRKFSVMLL